MNPKNTRLLVGTILLAIAVGLTWFGFTANYPNPIPALSSLGLAIVLFILALYLIGSAVRGLENFKSTPQLRKVGTFIMMIGASITIYAAIACFLIRGLPPNNENSRLPSVYLLFAGMPIMLTGTTIRNFQLRR